MIRCPVCHHNEPNGSLFCSECGGEIFDIAPGGVHEISLEMVESGEKLKLNGSREYTIGRVSKAQALIPDVDLSHSGAFHKGVSRLHAILKTKPGECTLMDLDSANGTKVNGIRVTACVDIPVKNGDTILLGSFKIIVHISEEQVTD
jgi:pSer/pThr/pTyr-binding forkhead associated (FHA) protein